ncbi:MAG: ATP-binding protein, partial [Planctomycetota bacterium]
STVPDEQGLPRILSLVADVTARKQIENALRKSDEELRRRVEELAAEDRRKDEFLAMLAHELRNPLAPLTTALHLIQARVGAQADVARPLAVMNRQTQHLSRLVDDLLEVSRITRGKIRLEREVIDAAVAVHRAVEISRPLIDAKKHDLKLVFPADTVWIDADLTRVAQVLGNLLNNSAKYTNEGGRITVTLAAEGEEAVLRIRDNGIGIPKTLMPRLFELFTQADTSLDRSQGGLGIGLTLVRGLVELHGGTIQARSDGPGQGAEFIVRLPLAPAPVAVEPEKTADRLRTPAPCRILIVDDNHDAADSLSELLTESGHEVASAYDGAKALELAKKFLPDVVLLDIGLPGLDGYSVARELRRRHADAFILVALTGYGQEEDRRRAREAGFDHHMVKPVRLDALSKLLAQAAPSSPPPKTA